MEHNDVKEAHNLSESEEGECSYDEYESDFDASDCSITSRLADDHLQKAIAPISNTPTLQADESANTTWTDDKHSSYLDSIEATFVRKMYGKEYCSLDVCGHSSQSSTSRELECVESHPLCLNMRKPHEQPVGLSPSRDLTSPWLSTSSVLASPWIQHFKAKQAVSAKKSGAQGNATKAAAPNLSTSTEKLQKPISTMHDMISNIALLKNNLMVPKKRAALFYSADCIESGAGGFKRLKCQQSLSQMDMVMEEQYKIEQQNQEIAHLAQQNEGKVPSDVTIEEHRMTQTGIHEPDELKKSSEAPQLRLLKEKHAKTMWGDMGPETTTLSKEPTSKKSDQVVPSSKDCCKEAGEQSIKQDKDMPHKEVVNVHKSSGDNGAYVTDEVNLSLHSSEQENTPTQLGSRTWTWGSQGLRYRLGGTMSTVNFKH